jgi:hypothetical protein
MTRSEFRVYAGPFRPNRLHAARATGKELAAPEDFHTRLKAELQTVTSIPCTPSCDGHSTPRLVVSLSYARAFCPAGKLGRRQPTPYARRNRNEPRNRFLPVGRQNGDAPTY